MLKDGLKFSCIFAEENRCSLRRRVQALARHLRRSCRDSLRTELSVESPTTGFAAEASNGNCVAKGLLFEGGGHAFLDSRVLRSARRSQSRDGVDGAFRVSKDYIASRTLSAHDASKNVTDAQKLAVRRDGAARRYGNRRVVRLRRTGVQGDAESVHNAGAEDAAVLPLQRFSNVVLFFLKVGSRQKFAVEIARARETRSSAGAGASCDEFGDQRFEQIRFSGGDSVYAIIQCVKQPGEELQEGNAEIGRSTIGPFRCELLDGGDQVAHELSLLFLVKLAHGLAYLGVDYGRERNVVKVRVTLKPRLLEDSRMVFSRERGNGEATAEWK